jgi:hypothetical protein
MRVDHLAFLAGVALALAGCSPTHTLSKPDLGDGSKLRAAIVGRWTASDNGKTVSYQFEKDGTYKYESGKLNYAGTWKVFNDRFVEISYDLSDEQLAEAKNEWKDAKAAVGDPQSPAAIRPPVAEPQKSNSALLGVEISGDELTMEFRKYKKAK